jgi:hypothetical protein
MNKKGVSLIAAGAIAMLILLLYRWAPATQMFHTAESLGIDTGAYYYTELEQSYEAEMYIRQSLQNSPWNKTLPLLAAVVLAVLLMALIFFIGCKIINKE